ncbi:hypothetical protein MHLP_01615 [Candidatus Mycoplasma haematolamae str. Purdue]|uniref:Uncharacterized protein n=1 Tax=Mycoplasma haematolamae (strain Purdue) TaxID=1212765 RepID=I7BJ89_MYCHA|nr:hypothetical protein [Candidatus Mycoplasma haematolamae]AFO51903.1 hypothetical protein MHLP_01615 [Candidatus Mycoplasma haematolamae str. Purdue]
MTFLSSAIGKAIASVIVAGGVSTGVTYPLVQGNGSYYAFFTGKTTQEVEGILLFTKSYYTDEYPGGMSYKLGIKNKEQWAQLQERWKKDKENFDPTLYIPVEIKDNNRSGDATALMEKMHKQIWGLIKESKETSKEYECLEKYVETPELASEFRSVFGEDTYRSLVEEVKKARQNIVN